MIDLALEFARNGWPVFPLAPRSKVPLAESRAFLDATTDPTRLEELWREPDCNIGIATGRRSGLFVVDIDTKEGRAGGESARQLALPQTLTVRTATGGYHLYFDLPLGTRCGSGQAMLPGVDWRCDGGYVVAPGSITVDGTYLIARNVPIVPAPAHLLERARKATKAYVVRHDDAGNMVLPEGSRDSDLHRIGCAVRNFGAGYAAILGALQAVNAEHCKPSLPEPDLERIAGSCTRHEPKHRSAA
jgi:hypothetical protein